jgi:CYTH domain-containing protein
MQPDRDLATEMAEPKYAHVERERRWLVDREARPDVTGQEFTLIEDRYLDDSRCRVRRMSKRGWTSCKFTKKYETDNPAARPIVTAYLSEAEFALFKQLPGRDIAKRRYRVPVETHVWSLDVFEGKLAGLELIESEVDDDEALASLVPPDWALREITDLPQWQGGALASAQTIPED